MKNKVAPPWQTAEFDIEWGEEDFFRQLGVPCWAPEVRTERRLMWFVRQTR